MSHVTVKKWGNSPSVRPSLYNSKTGLMLCCPMTTKIKGYPFDVVIAGNTPAAALSDQIKSLAWRRRNAIKKSRVSAGELTHIREKAKALIG